MNVFELAYKRLNLAQKQAVDAVEGPVMVIAGPGTGKTQILTLRIANILRQLDVMPENILAITFTEAGAAAMRRRLSEFIGSQAYSVNIKTFHGFCNDAIKVYPEYFPRIIGSENITEVDQIKILKDMIRHSELKELRPFSNQFYYLRSILGALNILKREGVSPEKFKEAVLAEEKYFEKIDDLYYEKGSHKGVMKGKYQTLRKRIDKNKELGIVYKNYEASLREKKAYDYNDMISEVLRALEANQNFLLILQEQYQYFLVDEHQDTNNAQNRILEMLCNFHEHPNIFVVGDEKQAIFRFQGASLENFYYFRSLYPDAALITLEDNYRSTQTILDSAESLIPGNKPLKSQKSGENKNIDIYAFSRPEVENYFLAEHLKSRIAAGVKPSDIAVLYRENKDAFPIADALEKSGVPFVIESDQNILTDNDIEKLLMVFEAVHKFGDQESLIRAMHADFFHIAAIDIYKIVQHANENKVAVFEILKSKETMESLKLDSIPDIETFWKNMSDWAVGNKNQYLLKTAETIFRDSGLLLMILDGPKPVEKIDKVSGLFREMKILAEKNRTARIGDFLEYVEIFKEQKILIKQSGVGRLAPGVRLMTAHRSKGQEFEYVYIANAYDGHWGNRRRADYLTLPPRIFSLTERPIEEANNLDDERRLFYVALTRAKKEAILTFAKEGDSAREQLPSRFIVEIKPELVEWSDASAYETAIASRPETLYSVRKPSVSVIRDKDFIKALFERNGLSVTALNNYLECPWRYFYTNLFRIPKAKILSQMYGTAIHAGLKDYFEKFKEEDPGKEFLIKSFEYHLKNEPLEEKDYKRTLGKGRKALSGYWGAWAKGWSRNILLEFNVRGVKIAPNVTIRGVIDKMEILNDGREVKVTDFKTGRPKTRGQIEGKTRDSNGDIKRQLVFYGLLLDRYKNSSYKMVSADVDFIEPDMRGKYRRESFEIAAEEIKNLEELIVQTADEILNLSFWDKNCGDKDCPYCRLQRMAR